MTRPLHIMMTTDAVGGVWVYATALSAQLARHGHRVTLVTLGPAPQGARLDEVRVLRPAVDLVVTNLSLEWLDPEGKDFDGARSELLAVAKRVRPDVVHINGYREGAIAWPCPSIAVAHSCVWSWWEAVHREQPQEARWRNYADAVRTGLNGVKAWIAPTEAFRRSIDRIYQPGSPGRVINNGIDLPDLSRPAKEPIILASGRVWDSGKNLMALAEIASGLPWPVYIAGAGVPTDSPASADVHWLGEIPHAELQAWMRRAAIYVAAGRYEPFGLGILEAGCAGCALVLSNIDSMRELWEGAALHVPVGNTEALRSALVRLCRHRRGRRRLQDAAAMRARQYPMHRTLAGYQELYEHVLSPAVEKPKVRARSELVA